MILVLIYSGALIGTITTLGLIDLWKAHRTD